MMKMSRMRALVALVVIGLTIGSFVFRLGFGSYSSFGFGGLMYACPVGILESMLSTKIPTWSGVFCFAIVVVITLIAGKAFCSWICPTPWVRRIFGVRDSKNDDARLGSKCASCSCDQLEGERKVAHRAACSKDPLPAVGGKRDGRLIDGRHGVLAGTLLSSFVLGFPVFCLACPIGLTFASVLAIGYAFSQHVFMWDLIVFPAVLVVELVIFRSWCFKVCPVSAMLSLLSSRKRIVRPRVGEDACLRTQGVDCRVCVDICPEKVDPHSLDIPECTQCGACVDACPMRAILLVPSAKR